MCTESCSKITTTWNFPELSLLPNCLKNVHRLVLENDEKYHQCAQNGYRFFHSSKWTKNVHRIELENYHQCAENEDRFFSFVKMDKNLHRIVVEKINLFKICTDFCTECVRNSDQRIRESWSKLWSEMRIVIEAVIRIENRDRNCDQNWEQFLLCKYVQNIFMNRLCKK